MADLPVQSVLLSPWERAQIVYHTVRMIDMDQALFKCMVCQCWFDGEVQMDRNFKFLTKGEFEQCPIAQIDLFDP